VQHIKDGIMRQIKLTIIWIILMINSISLYSQINQKDIIFDWINSSDSEWMNIDSTFQKFTPKNNEIIKAKELSIGYIDSLEKNREKQYVKILNHKHKSYYRQYVGYIDNKGDRIILINAFCEPFNEKRDLKTDWVFILDGGSCFYQIKINLSTLKCFDFFVNGVA
jgi:hypothetical protein